MPSGVGYRAAGFAPQIHRGLPSPYLTFVISLSDPVVAAAAPDQLHTAEASRTDVLVGALHHRPAYIWQKGAEEGLQLAVHPLAAPALFGVPASELRSLVTDGIDLLGPPVARLRERLGDTGSWSMRFAVLEDYLRGRATAAPPRHQPRPEVVAAWTWLARHRGTGSMAGLAAYVGLSSRQLGTLFSREVGASPKQVSRLMRFHVAQQQVRQAVVGGQPLDLTGIAARTGFYDSAHLVRDFRQYAGLSPTGWVAAEFRNIQADPAVAAAG